jgi:hypothetical protein
VTHPIFARLDDQLRLVEQELQNLRASDAKSRELKARHPQLYDEWTHRSATAEGVRSVYSGLEKIMEAIANEVDQYEPPRSDNWHEKLIDQLSVKIDGVRDALLGPGTRAQLHELRKFRHVIHHRYAQSLETAKVFENYERLRKAVPAFKRDYKRLAKALQAAPES